MSELVAIKAPEDQQEGTESRVGTWFKQAGDHVTQHEPLLELNTDKVNMEVSAPVSGTLTTIVKHPEQEVMPGDVLGYINPSPQNVVRSKGLGSFDRY